MSTTNEPIPSREDLLAEISRLRQELNQVQKTSELGAEQYSLLFQHMPLGAQEEDYSAIRKGVDELISSGVKNLTEYFKSHPNTLFDLVCKVKNTSVNEALLIIHRASSNEDFTNEEEDVATWWNDDWFEYYSNEIPNLLKGNTYVSPERPDIRSDGSPFVSRTLTFVVAGCEASWSRVVTLHEDITDRKRMEKQLLESQIYLESQVKERTKALKESETRLKQAEKLTQIGYWVWDVIEDKAISCSEEYARIHGVPVREWILFENFAEQNTKWIHPDDQDYFSEKFLEFSKTHKPYELEYRLVTPQGEIRRVRDIAEPEFDENGVHIRTLGSIQDITKHKQLQDDLRQSQKLQAVGQLTGGIAHDFNNILGIVMGNLELLKDQVANDDNALRRIDTADKATQRAADLVKQLLSFSRQQSTNVVVDNINRVILDMDNLIKRSVTPQVEVNLSLFENLWLTEINLGDFQDAILNLVLNAHDAMPNGGQLTIETANCALGEKYCDQFPNLVAGEYLQVSVSDSGTGIPANLQDKIFDPFYTTKEVGKGTGLGLSMVFGFVTRSDGHIMVQSEPGNGTTFIIYLPRAAAQALPGSSVDQAPQTLPEGSESILVVDDEVALLELTKVLLEKLGYRVVTATNGKQGLEQLAKHPSISMLISDVVMPGGINGYELVEKAAAIRPDIKLLLTSGHTKKARSGVSPTTNILMKPYTHKALAQQVRSILDDSNL